ncbi:MAG: nucleoside triphosphate pyrophosphohydrolase [Candidatus Eisenbacteria bacterium]
MSDRMDPGRLFSELVEMVARLRAPDGCPWDRKQTYETIRPHFLEEAHEAAEALACGDFDEFREEIGDTLFLAAFLVRIAEEEGRFAIADSLASILDKMRRRHPHVYGDARGMEEREIRVSWEEAKRREKGKSERESILDGIPASLPALLRARRVQQKASNIGFDWPEAAPVLDKIEEELGELREAETRGEPEALIEEIGDLLFSVVNLARLLDVDPEVALNRSTAKFRDRFLAIEEKIDPSDPPPLEVLDRLWEDAKKDEERRGAR